MHTLSWPSLVFLASAGAAHAATNEPSGVMEVDLVFPRNESYAPTAVLPVVFGFQNPELAHLLGPQISFTIWNLNNMSDTPVTASYDLRWVNFSSSNGTYYEYRPYTEFNTEGNWMLKWSFRYGNCTEKSISDIGDDRIVFNSSNTGIRFTTKNAAQKIDVAVISEGCSKNQGFAFNITGTHDTPAGVNWAGGETCAAVASSTPVPDPCRVKVGAAAASSMLASMTNRLCEGGYSQIDCPSKGSAAPREIVGGVAGLMVVLGALSYFLM